MCWARPGGRVEIEGFRGDDLGKLGGLLFVVGLVVGFVAICFAFFFFFEAMGCVTDGPREKEVQHVKQTILAGGNSNMLLNFQPELWGRDSNPF